MGNKKKYPKCDERCIKLGYCPYYLPAPDWCGQPYKYRKNGVD